MTSPFLNGRPGAVIPVLFAVFICLSAPADAGPESPDVPGLRLEQAVSLALEHSPKLGVASDRVGSATARRAQASILPNPEIAISADNLYGDYNGTDSAEIAYEVSQRIEMPGKRKGRIRMAESSVRQATNAEISARLDLIRDVTIAFADMAALQQDIALLEEEQALAGSIRDAVAARVDAGKEPPIQKNKAEIERSSSAIALDRARRQMEARKRALLMLMGVSSFPLSGDVDADSLPGIEAPQDIEFYRSRLPQTPDMRVYDFDVDGAEADLSLERAQSVPDPTFRFGIKDAREDDKRSIMAGISFPLPVFDINRSGIERAGYDLNSAIKERHGARLSMDAEIARVYSDLSGAYHAVDGLREFILPGAEESLSFARQGYEAGKFNYLDVLDAQRTLFDARRQLIEGILEYHRQRATIERMAAIHMGDQ